MINVENYNAKLGIYAAMPAEYAVRPTMPVDLSMLEAEDLYKYALIDFDELVRIGVDAALINDLFIRTTACRQAQSNWMDEYRILEEAQKAWLEASPIAFELRDELLHTFFYAFRNYKDLILQTRKTAEGATRADMIQDLNDMAVAGKTNIALLEAIDFDTTKLDQAASLSAQLADLLSEANGNKQLTNEALLIRDKAYTHVKDAVDVIRSAGKFLFWKNEEKLKLYLSPYLKTKNIDY